MRRRGDRRASDSDRYQPFIEAGSLRLGRDAEGDVVELAITDPFPADLRLQALLDFGAMQTSTLKSLDLGGSTGFSESDLDECLGWLAHVSTLAVPHGLSDRMAARVRKLIGLRTLDLSSLPMLGPGPATWIGAITSLEHLVLGPAATDADFAAAARLERLRRLELVGNHQVTDSGFAALASSESLAEVSIWHSAFGPESLTRLAAITSLRRVEIEGAGLQPEHFAGFTAGQFEAIELPTSLRDRSGLELLVHLAPRTKSLSLSGWTLGDDDLSLLSTLPSLETLRLEGCDWLSDKGLDHVGRLVSLRKLDLTRCRRISARGLGSLRNLSLDELRHPPLPTSDESLAFLVDRCRNAREELVVTDADTRPETARRAIERWHPAKVVLRGRRFDDSLLDALAADGNLRHLDVTHTAMSEALLTRLAGRKLDSLELPPRLRTDATLAGWPAVVRIGQDLDLRNWRITSAAVAALPLTADDGRPFRSIRLPRSARDDTSLGEWLRRVPPRTSKLDLRRWRITDASLPMLAAFPTVTRLDLRETLVSLDGLSAFQGRVMRGLRLPRACDTPAGQIRRSMALGKTERIRLKLSDEALSAEDVHVLALACPREVGLAGLEAVSAETLAALREEAGRLTSLEKLVLKGTIGDEVVDIVEAVPSVRRLDLSATNVTDAGLRRLRDREFQELKVPRGCRGPGGSVRAFIRDIQEPPGTVVNSIGMRLVPIAPGRFRMGAGKDDPHANSTEEHPHTVEITRPFLIGMHAVTQAEFQRVMGTNPSLTRGDTHPVDHVEWQTATDFCERLSALPEEQSAGRAYRLPTEAEWEYCCRAGTDTPWNMGPHLPHHRARFSSGYRSGPAKTVPVGTYPPNAWGLHEMHGNVWEWTGDWYGYEYYKNSRRINPFGPASGTHHAARGGSASVQGHECRSAIRGEAYEDVIGESSLGRYGHLGDFGLRVVCEVPVSAGLPTRTHRILDRHLGSEDAGQVGMGLALLRASDATEADIREAISRPVLHWIVKHALLDGVRPEILEPLVACLGKSDAVREEWEVMVACRFADPALAKKESKKKSSDNQDRRLTIIEACAGRPALASLHDLLSRQPAAPDIALDSLSTLSVSSAKRLAKHKGRVSLRGLESVSGKVRGILDAAQNISRQPAAAGLKTDSRTVRIFISSTFRDFTGERDLLVRKVFPELRRRCRERQVELVDVDLRWGITEVEAEQGKVLPICLAEIDRARPFFMGLLGERYGWVPAAGQFDRSLLIEQPWLEEHAGGKSVTELEILHGVLNNPEIAGRAFFYFRDPAWSATQGVDYAIGSEAEREKLADLKGRIRSSGMPVREAYADPASLAGIVLEDLWTALDKEFPAGTEPTPLEREALDHSAFAASRYTVFVGRDEHLQLLSNHVTHDRQPIVVTGEPGSGKSALLANWVRLQRSRATSAWIFEHYVGASAQSTTYADLIRRIIAEIARALSIQAEVSDATADLVRQFPEWLEKLSAELQAKGTSAVLVLDGLDQMHDEDSAAELRWLPQQFPTGVQVIVSAQPGFGLETLKKRGWPIVSLPLLSEPDRKALVRDSLARYRKSLTTERLSRLASAPAAANPLYLKALVDELRVCASHETLDEQMQSYLEASDSPSLFGKVLERIETDHEADAPGLVRDALRLLWAARDGCSEAELLVLLKRPGEDRLPQAVWSPVYVAIEPFLVRRAGLYTLCHAFFRQAVQKRYFADEKDARAAHRILADFFEHEQPSPRTEREAAWQLYEALENARLNAYLRQPGNFMLLLKNAVDDLGRFISVACANEDKTTFIQNVLTDYLTHQPDSWAQDVFFVPIHLERLCDRIGDSGIWVKDFINANQRATKGRVRVLRGRKLLTMAAVAEGSFASQVNELVLSTEKALIDPLCFAVRNAESLLYDCHYGAGLPADSPITLSDIHSEMRRLLDAAERGFGKRAELETEYVTSGDEAYEWRSARRKYLLLIGELRALMAEKEEDYEHAHVLLDEALAMAEGFWGTSHAELLPVLRAIVNTAKTSGAPSRGLAAAHRGLSLCLADDGPVHPDIKWWLQNYCARAIDLGEPTLAEDLCSEVLKKQEALVGTNHLELVHALRMRAQVRYKSGDATGEKQDYQRALAILDAVEEPDEDLRTSITEQYEALLAEEHATDHVSLAGPGAGGAGDDGQSLDRILQDWIMVSQAQRHGRLESFQRLADRLAAHGCYAAAGRLYARALEGCELFLGGEHPATDHYRRLHAECRAALGSSE